MEFLVINFLIFIILTSLSWSFTSPLCSSICLCIWRNGKQTVLCEKQSLNSIPSGISSGTQVLNLNKNDLQILPSKIFQELGLINLQKIFLSECNISSIYNDAFTQLTNLIELDLSKNQLNQVPSESLKHCFNLRRLQLNQNEIKLIESDSFSTLTQLKSLDLSSSKIELIQPNAFRGLERLEFLKIDDNRLSILSFDVLNDLPILYSLDLYKNPWNCNCDLRATKEWILKNNIPQSIEPMCFEPQRLAGFTWNLLEIDDFSCGPEIISQNTEFTRHIGGNLTISCQVKGLPKPKISWFVNFDGIFMNLSSKLLNAEKYFVVEEENDNGLTTSFLTIINLKESDKQNLICLAESRSGFTKKSFSLIVLPIVFGLTQEWTFSDFVTLIIGFFISLIVFFIVIIILLIRTRNVKPASVKSSSLKLHQVQNGNQFKDGIFDQQNAISKSNHVRIIENQMNKFNCNYQEAIIGPDLTKINFNHSQIENFHEINSSSLDKPVLTCEFPIQNSFIQNPNICSQSVQCLSPLKSSLQDQRWKSSNQIVELFTPKIRHSPDEGYAEDVNHIEGTEV